MQLNISLNDFWFILFSKTSQNKYMLYLEHKLDDGSIQSALSINIGGWWYNACYYVNLNHDNVYKVYKSIKMAIRPQ